MANIQSTQIIFRKGERNDLPEKLESGELGFAINDGSLALGIDARYGQPNYDRSEFPYTNIELLTERSIDAFKRMHDARLKDGGDFDYYDVILAPDKIIWVPVIHDRAEDYAQYIVDVRKSVSMFIDYAVMNNLTGEPVRDGRLILWYHPLTNIPTLTDDASQPRSRDAGPHSSYDPTEVFGTVKFRFRLDLETQQLHFEYKNYSFDHLIMQFRVSRPYEAGDHNILRSVVVIETTILATV